MATIVATATILVVFRAQQAWTVPFKFEVDMTSQAYTYFIWAHMGDLVWRYPQCKSLSQSERKKAEVEPGNGGS